MVKTFSKLIILMLTTAIIFGFMQFNMTAMAQTTNADNVISAMNSVTPGNVNSTAASKLSGIIGGLLGFLRLASGLVAILMIAITGFNYIIGGAEVKEEMKKKMFPIILGLLLVFGAASIAIFVMGVISGT